MTFNFTNAAHVEIHAWSRADGAMGVKIAGTEFALDLEDAVQLHDKLCEALSVRRKVLEREKVESN